ncbi:hypothetical protein L6164_029498 [Bauhinia variegata]|uniref:Uncharacterized protein n=1 Tax=Bauhinia variegata TaxID=167791 RepID=A0ACB9L9Q5_BAUVA|nr:hypothetical protein L6164_029498 [Bauhinia variegata]
MSRSLRLLFLSLCFLFLVFSVAAHSGHNDDDDADAAATGDVDEDHHHDNLRAKPLILVKIWCLIIVFFATFVAGISPYVLKWNEGFLVLGTQFAGGVFLVFGKQNSSSVNGADVELQGDDEAGKVHGGGSHHLANLAFPSAISLGDTILLIFALCFHSVFEGIAIGVAETKDDAWRALWTISLHKVFAAIAMGIALLRMIPNRPLLSCAAYAFAFAISSPVGVAIGIIIDTTTQGAAADWIFAISMSLACGVFIYVAVNHLLAKGYISQKPVKVETAFHKFLAVVLGVGVIAVVMIWDT